MLVDTAQQIANISGTPLSNYLKYMPSRFHIKCDACGALGIYSSAPNRAEQQTIELFHFVKDGDKHYCPSCYAVKFQLPDLPDSGIGKVMMARRDAKWAKEKAEFEEYKKTPDFAHDESIRKLIEVIRTMQESLDDVIEGLRKEIKR